MAARVWAMLAPEMGGHRTRADRPAVTAGEERDPDPFREAVRRHAVKMGISPAAAERVVRPDLGTPPPAAPDGPRGAHPGVVEVLMQASAGALRDVDAGSLRRKPVPEQLHAIAKLGLYREFEDAVREIWPGIEGWLEREGCLLGEIGTTPVLRPGGGHATVQALLPVGPERLERIRAAPSFRHTCGYVSYHVRCVWHAHLALWAERHRRGGGVPTVPLHFQQGSGKRFHHEFLWSGVNTAIKMMVNSVVLLHELFLEREGGSAIERGAWRRMLDANRSFLSLFAASGVNDFVTFDRMVEAPHDPAFLEFLGKEELLSSTRAGAPEAHYLPFYRRRYFRLVDDSRGVPRLDLRPEAFTATMRAQFGGDIMIRRCPALRVGVINRAYGWVARAITELAGSALR